MEFGTRPASASAGFAATQALLYASTPTPANIQTRVSGWAELVDEIGVSADAAGAITLPAGLYLVAPRASTAQVYWAAVNTTSGVPATVNVPLGTYQLDATMTDPVAGVVASCTALSASLRVNLNPASMICRGGNGLAIAVDLRNTGTGATVTFDVLVYILRLSA
ncbi:MAG: hypothetical protein ACR2MO_08635 [Acidimicrobiales bacterium]